MATGISPLLRDIHRLRRHLRDLEAELQRIPRLRKAHQNQFALKEKELTDVRAAIKHDKLIQQQRESDLASSNDQLAKSERQLNEIMNAKEYTTKKSEIERHHARVSELEETIFGLIATIDAAEARIPVLEEEILTAQETLAQFETESAQRKERLEREHAHASAELAKVESQIPIDIRDKLARLVAAHGADALAAVRTNACGHCHMNLNLAQLTQLQGGSFLTCGGCGRAVYVNA